MFKQYTGKQLQDIKLQIKSSRIIIPGMELCKKANHTFKLTLSITALSVKVQNASTEGQCLSNLMKNQTDLCV